ncbi:sporulation sigma factor SigK [uncultured Caudovirales phage]|uniref:Sporulation sigma factor SigK n=1 Tax=uncultured Caudovirales phage TaxID=2100421 RepID=A0A6J5RG49_9CAUD|nr:sporulation sigma factor SigK [uncultured Caudovirales phage]
MLSIEEAQELMEKFIELRGKSQDSKSNEDLLILKKHERICIEKFKYLVTMKTGRYKSFSNYDDLTQEGMEALIKAMKNYNPKKGIWFWWAHKYIDTRISRSANLHTTIRYPLKVAKDNTPHKEAIMPILIEENYCPDKELESLQVNSAIKNVMDILTKEQKEIINLAFGFDGDKPMSVNKICKKMNISRLSCIKTMNGALSVMKEKIKI